jgi:hypothetical protein
VNKQTLFGEEQTSNTGDHYSVNSLASDSFNHEKESEKRQVTVAREEGLIPGSDTRDGNLGANKESLRTEADLKKRQAVLAVDGSGENQTITFAAHQTLSSLATGNQTSALNFSSNKSDTSSLESSTSDVKNQTSTQSTKVPDENQISIRTGKRNGQDGADKRNSVITSNSTPQDTKSRTAVESFNTMSGPQLDDATTQRDGIEHAAAIQYTEKSAVKLLKIVNVFCKI